MGSQNQILILMMILKSQKNSFSKSWSYLNKSKIQNNVNVWLQLLDNILILIFYLLN